VGIETIEGALATLKRVPLSKQLHEKFSEPALFRHIGLRKAPEFDVFKGFLEDHELIVWNVIPEGKQQPWGYALYVTFNGPPFVALHPFNLANVDLELARDVLLQLVHYFFQNTDEEALFYYEPKPVKTEVNDLLVEGGFDLFDDNPTVDPDEVCYVLERYTYDAYYGEEKGGREGEFDNYEDGDEEEEALVGDDE
jgi:hypothetical protein